MTRSFFSLLFVALIATACNKADVERPVQQGQNNPQLLEVVYSGSSGYTDDDDFHASIHPEVRDYFNDSTVNAFPVKGCYNPKNEGTGGDLCPGNICDCGTVTMDDGFEPTCDCDCCPGVAAGNSAESYGYHLDWPADYHDAMIWNKPSGPSYDQGKAINEVVPKNWTVD